MQNHLAQFSQSNAPALPGGDLRARILRIVSHELRTPLNAIIGFADLLASPRPLSEAERIEYAQYISAGGHELLASVNALLDMSRIEAGNYTLELEPLDGFSVLEACCRSVCEDEEIVIEPDPGQTALLIADKKALTVILTNLIANAFKFTGPDGQVELSLRDTGRGVLFEVSDDGCGMAPEFVETLGTPFVQEEMGYRRNASGAGLGLAIVKGLVKLHGGRLTIESKLGAGTKASVWLPARASGQCDDTILGNAA